MHRRARDAREVADLVRLASADVLRGGPLLARHAQPGCIVEQVDRIERLERAGAGVPPLLGGGRRDARVLPVVLERWRVRGKREEEESGAWV